jgi:hypothetical protein
MEEAQDAQPKPQVPVKSSDYLPNLGIKTPENDTEKEKIRQSVVDVVREIQKPDNFDNFKEAAIAMFTQLGLPPSEQSEDLQLTEKKFQESYVKWHSNMQGIKAKDTVRIDIEMFGKDLAYGNIYLYSTLVAGKRITGVGPGACSLPRAIEPNLTYHTPEKNFYKVFEEVIGVDPQTKVKDMYKRYPQLANLENPKRFYVINDSKENFQYIRVPYNELVFSALLGLGIKA